MMAILERPCICLDQVKENGPVTHAPLWGGLGCHDGNTGRPLGTRFICLSEFKYEAEITWVYIAENNKAIPVFAKKTSA